MYVAVCKDLPDTQTQHTHQKTKDDLMQKVGMVATKVSEDKVVSDTARTSGHS